MTQNYYKSGEWNVTCDVCSKKIKASESKQRWDGLIVCADDFEYRHPQDFVRARQDKISVPFTRPIPTLTYVTLACDIWTSQGVADEGVADCAQADLNNHLTWDDWIGLYCTFPMQHAIPNEAVAGCVVAGKYIQGHI